MKKSLFSFAVLSCAVLVLLTGCSKKVSDEEAAANVAALIDAIYVQQRTDKTDKQCADAEKAWDALTDAQKEMVEGEEADPDYFGRDTGDTSKGCKLSTFIWPHLQNCIIEKNSKVPTHVRKITKKIEFLRENLESESDVLVDDSELARGCRYLSKKDV